MICERYNLPTDALMPNNQDLPVLIYRDVAPWDHLAALLEGTFAANGWGGIWRGGIYDYHHFHSNAHEVLGVASGHATLRLGGPTGIVLSFVTGDCLILPAGTGHCCINASPDFQVIGAYPQGQEDYDIQRSWQDKPGIRAVVRDVPIPGNNPLKGLIDEADTLWNDHLPDFLDIPSTPVSYTSSQSGFGTGQ